jgi:hypothetical protein
MIHSIRTRILQITPDDFRHTFYVFMVLKTLSRFVVESCKLLTNRAFAYGVLRTRARPVIGTRNILLVLSLEVLVGAGDVVINGLKQVAIRPSRLR